MKAFLELIAEKILQNPCYQTDKSIIVFPNRRAGLFLNKFLKKSGKTFFMPKILGMNNFVEQTSGMTIIKNEFLLFELFRIHKELSLKNNNDKYQTFEEFIPFADTILKDFSDIDLHLVDAKQLFTNIYNEKELLEWDISNPDHLSEFQRKYLAFYESLYEYYSRLQEVLKRENKAYSAMIYRKVAENINEYADKLQWEKVMFVGFHEISQCEKTIFKTLMDRGIAEFVADIDEYYLDKDMEAGRLLHSNSDLWKTEDYEPEKHFNQGERQFTITSCPEKTLQCEYVGNIVKQTLDNKHEIEDTVIVLADENQLVPVLNSMPKEIKKANVTMGFPYTYTLTHNLLTSFLDVYDNFSNGKHYVKPVIQFLSHYLIEKTLGINNLQSKLTKKFVKDSKFYIIGEELLAIVPELEKSGLDFLFAKTEYQTRDLIEMFKRLAKKVKGNCNDLREQIALQSAYEIFEHFTELQEKYDFVDKISTLRKIYQRIAVCITLSFQGEPLEGLQIMGLQETKNVDFKNLIIVSCNEGIIPKGASHNSLIPYNLRKGFGMFTYQDRDAAEAYNFYRLLQRAENVHFIYQTDTDGGNKGEASRYLVQIEKELVKQFPNIHLSKQTLVTTQTTDSKELVLSKPKTGAVIEKLKANAKEGRGFSPSAMNTYRNCPLSYYYKYVLDIKDPDSLEEDIEIPELGSIIHKILENMFIPFVGKQVEADKLPEGAELEQIIDDYFKENVFKDQRTNTGENYFMLQVAKEQIKRFVKNQKEELKNHEYTIIGLERELFGKIQINSDLQVQIHGFADRIETIDGITRIGDYKTGKVEPMDLKGSKEFFEDKEFDNENMSDKLLQVMYYALVFSKENADCKEFKACIYSLKYFNQFDVEVSIMDSPIITKEHLGTFEEYVKLLVSEIFNTEINFEQNLEGCDYCSFNSICNRQGRAY